MTPAAVELTASFGLSSTVWVNLCAMSFGICAIPFTFISIWAFKKFPTSNVLRIASAFMFLGAQLRLLGFYLDEFWPLLAGQIICASAAPFFINVQSVIANKWFSDKERATAQSVQMGLLPFGAAATMGIQSVVFKDTEDIYASL